MFVLSKNTRTKLESLGDIELKYVSYEDTKDFFSILQKQLSEKNFTAQVLFHQLVEPKLDFEKFYNISDIEIEKLGRAFVENEKQTFIHFNNTGDFFKDFKQALVTFYKTHNKELDTTLNPSNIFAEELLKDSPIRQVIDLTNEAIVKVVQEISKSSLVQQTIDLASDPTIKYCKEMLNDSFINEVNILQRTIDRTIFNQDLLRTFANSVKQISDIQNHTIEAFKSIIEQYEGIKKQIDEFLNTSLINFVFLTIDSLQKWIEQNRIIFDSYSIFWKAVQRDYDIAEIIAVKVLKKYKWFITPSFPTSFIFKIVKLDKKKGRQDKAVNECFIKYFKAKNWRNLEKMVKDWKNKHLLKKRYKILVDCVKTIRIISKKGRNEANIILPTLISQIDGVLTDYLNSKDFQWECSYDDWIDRKTGKVIKIGRKTQYKNVKSQVLSTQLDDLANTILLDILFQKSQKGKPLATPFNFNRHKIIHGESVKYGRRDYMIRAFMVLDFLANLS